MALNSASTDVVDAESASEARIATHWPSPDPSAGGVANGAGVVGVDGRAAGMLVVEEFVVEVVVIVTPVVPGGLELSLRSARPITNAATTSATPQIATSGMRGLEPVWVFAIGAVISPLDLARPDSLGDSRRGKPHAAQNCVAEEPADPHSVQNQDEVSFSIGATSLCPTGCRPIDRERTQLRHQKSYGAKSDRCQMVHQSSGHSSLDR
jgi:hypothetical protein